LLIGCFFWMAPLLAQEIEYVGSIDNLGWSNAVFVEGNYAYLACDDISFHIINVSDPANPEEVGSFDTPTYASEVFAVDSVGFVLDQGTGLYILNISDPEGIQLMSHYQTEDDATGLFVSEGYAFVVTNDSILYRSLQIIDISDPFNPLFMSSGQFAKEKVFVAGDYAYAPTGDCDFYGGCGGAFRIIDISDASIPLHVGTYTTGWNPARSIFVDGDYAYLATGGHWLFNDFGDFRIIDVSDKTSPVLVGSFNFPHGGLQFFNAFTEGGYAYTSATEHGMVVVDVTDPSEPTLAGEYSAYGAGTDVHVVDCYIYFAEPVSLTILRFIPTDVRHEESETPAFFPLSPNYPNPFNSSTTIEYTLPQEANAIIEIYDILGRKVETLVSGKQQAGSHSIVWDAGDTPSGIYFYRIEAGEYSQAQKCVLLK
jgi:hypothetical protein